MEVKENKAVVMYIGTEIVVGHVSYASQYILNLNYRNIDSVTTACSSWSMHVPYINNIQICE